MHMKSRSEVYFMILYTSDKYLAPLFLPYSRMKELSRIMQFGIMHSPQVVNSEISCRAKSSWLRIRPIFVHFPRSPPSSFCSMRCQRSEKCRVMGVWEYRNRSSSSSSSSSERYVPIDVEIASWLQAGDIFWYAASSWSLFFTTCCLLLCSCSHYPLSTHPPPPSIFIWSQL